MGVAGNALLGDLSLAWGNPDWRWIAIAALPLLVLVFAVDRALRRRALARLGEARALDRMAQTRSGARRAVKAGLFTGGLVLALVAMAQPQTPLKRAPPPARSRRAWSWPPAPPRAWRRCGPRGWLPRWWCRGSTSPR